MYELLLVLSLLTSIAGLTTLLRFFAPRFQQSQMPAASAGGPVDAEFLSQNLLETYLSYRA